MAKMKFDFQKLFLEQGEKIGLGIAGLLLAILAVMGLMAATSSASSTAITEQMKSNISTVNRKLQGGDAPPEDPTVGAGSVVFAAANRNDFPIRTAMFDPSANIDQKRGKPKILPVDKDVQIEFVHAAIGIYDIKGTQVAVVRERTKAKSDTKAIDKVRRNLKRPQRPAPKAPPPPQQQPPGVNPQNPYNPPGAAGGPGGGGRGGRDSSALTTLRSDDGEIQYMSLDSKDLDQAQLALALRPERMVVVSGTVPYKKQYEEYQRALRARSLGQLVQEQAVVLYRGFDVRRQVLDTQGTVIQDWQPLDYREELVELYARAADFEPDDQRLLPLRPDPEHQLLLPRPKLVRGSYGDVSNLAGVKRALEELAKNGPPVSVPNRGNRLKGNDLDIFNPGPGAGGPTSGGGPVPGGGNPDAMRGARLNPDVNPYTGGPGGMANLQSSALADAWLFRFIDVNVEPGYSYRYQIRLKVQNPNYGRKDVASPSLALNEELVGDWTELPGSVAVPPEEHLFAVSPPLMNPNTDTVPLKFHHWYDYLRVSAEGVLPEPLGEWVIADIAAKRGQYVFEKKPIKVPLWSMTQAAFYFKDRITIGGPKVKMSDRIKMENVQMDFAPLNQAIVVDFEGGRMSYKIPNSPKPSVVDEGPVEVLMWLDDGRLTVCRNSARDAKDEARKTREETWERWLNEVASGFRPRTGPVDPFGSGNPPAIP